MEKISFPCCQALIEKTKTQKIDIFCYFISRLFDFFIYSTAENAVNKELPIGI